VAKRPEAKLALACRGGLEQIVRSQLCTVGDGIRVKQPNAFLAGLFEHA